MAEAVTSSDLTIVGVGASAGGLEAFRELFSRLASEEKLSIILIQHLDPDHKSMLQELLTKRTSTKVVTIEDNMVVEAGVIYLIPPGFALTLAEGVLQLKSFETPRGQRRPIDTFFQSLANDAGERAVSIILSGTGSDGSAGIKAIKEAGGLVIAQDPRQATYDGMPRSALATGAVDLTLTVEEMAEVLKDYRRRRAGVRPAIENDLDFVTQIFKHVRFHTGQDFSQYKKSTLLRRLTVRMSVIGTKSPGEYLDKVIHDHNEAMKLQRDVLINVTSFFRDPEAFESLAKECIEHLCTKRAKDDPIRIWIPGCSTGEEAYSIGMLIARELEKQASAPKVTIFGSDIDDEALQFARLGQYSNGVASAIPPDLLENYMVPTTTGYEVSKKLRELVRFSQHNVAQDPPFAKLDLVSCRNLLIYFEKPLQKHVLGVFSYALKPGGHLLLGMSENISADGDFFEDVVSTHHLHKRTQTKATPLNLSTGPLSVGYEGASKSSDSHPTSRRAIDAARDAIARRHAPPYIITSNTGLVSHASEGAERFLRVRSGDFQQDLSALIHPALESVVRRLNNQSNETDGDVSAAVFEGMFEGQQTLIDVTSERLTSGERFFVFHERAADYVRVDRELKSSAGDESSYVRELEQELDDARQSLRTTIEELETSNEELKSSNEEMMSMNEELQSGNEELSTINEELSNKISEVNAINADIAGFVASTSLATVFLDGDFQLRRYTPEAQKYFRIVEADIGRSIGDIVSDLPTYELLKLCRSVIKGNIMIEQDFTTLDGAGELLVKAVPVQIDDQPRRGVVFSLVDVTKLRTTVRELQKAKDEAKRNLSEVEELYSVSPTAMGLFGPDLTYQRVNPKLAEINGFPIDDHYGKRVEDIVPDLGSAVIEPIKHVFETGEPLLSQEVVGRTAAAPDEEHAWIVDWYPLREDGKVAAVGVNVRDVTAYKQMQDELTRVMRELQHRVKNMLGNITALVNRARREKDNPDKALLTLFQRIDALGKTHKLLATENWQSTNFLDIIGPELTDVYGEDVVTIKGPNIQCNARATLALGMAVHELATNAAKYGALSQMGGKLSFTWFLIDEGEGEHLRLLWEETGGPRVEAPSRKGFGTTLVSSTIERSLGGRAEMTWNPEGLVCVISIPIDAVTSLEGEMSDHLF